MLIRFFSNFVSLLIMIIRFRRMFYIRTFIILSCLACGFSSCKTDSKQESESDSGSIQVNISVEDLDKQLFACKSVEEVQSFLDKHSYLTQWYFTDAPVEKAQLPAHLFQILQNKDF